MTKCFCDRCGKEILDGFRCGVKIFQRRNLPDDDYEYHKIYEVCPTCAKMVQRYIESNLEEEKP